METTIELERVTLPELTIQLYEITLTGADRFVLPTCELPNVVRDYILSISVRQYACDCPLCSQRMVLTLEFL